MTDRNIKHAIDLGNGRTVECTTKSETEAETEATDITRQKDGSLRTIKTRGDLKNFTGVDITTDSQGKIIQSDTVTSSTLKTRQGNLSGAVVSQAPQRICQLYPWSVGKP